MSKLEGKVAFITGSASGIGKELALEFSREGAKIVIADLNGEAAKTAAEEIRSAGGLAISVAVDVTDEAQVEAAVQAAVQSFGNVDVLISNAGIQIVHPIVICPGFVRTPLVEKQIPEQAKVLGSVKRTSSRT